MYMYMYVSVVDCHQILRTVIFDGSGIRNEERAGKTDFHRESNSGSVTGNQSSALTTS